MILPIYLYGQPVLKKMCLDIEADYKDLEKLIANMWDTMDNANGVGIAAPQIGRAIRLFIVNSKLVYGDEEEDKGKGVKKVFINAQKVSESGEPWAYEEGCLSIPDVRGDVERPESITIKYLDENFKEHTDTYTGVDARVIQHEYDHIDGILFTELVKPLKRKMISRKLDKIKKGIHSADYRVK